MVIHEPFLDWRISFPTVASRGTPFLQVRMDRAHKNAVLSLLGAARIKIANDRVAGTGSYERFPDADDNFFLGRKKQ